MKPDQICCSTLIWAEHDLEAAVKEIAAIGLRAVELGYWTGAPRQDPARYGAAKDVRALLMKHGLRAAAATVYGPDRPDRMRFAAEVGCDVCIINGLGKTMDEVVKNLQPLLDLARELGVGLAYENHINSPVDTIESMEELARRVPDRTLGFILATHHFGALRQSPVEAVHRLKGRMRVLYLWDAPRNYHETKSWGDAASHLPGGGMHDFAPIFTALDEIGFNGCADLMCLGTSGWAIEQIAAVVRQAHQYCLARLRSA